MVWPGIFLRKTVSKTSKIYNFFFIISSRETRPSRLHTEVHMMSFSSDHPNTVRPKSEIYTPE